MTASRTANVRGMAALLAAALLFATTTTLVRLASNSLSGYFISTVRFAVGVVLSIAWLTISGRGVRIGNKRDWLLRGLYGAISMTLSYMAISRTSGGRATMLSNTYPIFVALFGRMFFGQRLLPTAIPALVLCTAGSIIILNDGSGYALAGDAMALLSAVFAGLAINHLKRARVTDDPVSLYLSPCIFGLPVVVSLTRGTGGLPAVPHGAAIAMAVGLGFIVFGAQVLMTWGYKYVNAASGSRIFYLEIIFAVILGALIGERLRPAFFAGAGVIMAALSLDWFVVLRGARTGSATGTQ